MFYLESGLLICLLTRLYSKTGNYPSLFKSSLRSSRNRIHQEFVAVDLGFKGHFVICPGTQVVTPGRFLLNYLWIN